MAVSRMATTTAVSTTAPGDPEHGRPDGRGGPARLTPHAHRPGWAIITARSWRCTTEMGAQQCAIPRRAPGQDDAEGIVWFVSAVQTDRSRTYYRSTEVKHHRHIRDTFRSMVFIGKHIELLEYSSAPISQLASWPLPGLDSPLISSNGATLT